MKFEDILRKLDILDNKELTDKFADEFCKRYFIDDEANHILLEDYQFKNTNELQDLISQIYLNIQIE